MVCVLGQPFHQQNKVASSGTTINSNLIVSTKTIIAEIIVYYSAKPENAQCNIFNWTGRFGLYICYGLAGVNFLVFRFGFGVLFCFNSGYIISPGAVTCGIAAWEQISVAWEDKWGIPQQVH